MGSKPGFTRLTTRISNSYECGAVSSSRFESECQLTGRKFYRLPQQDPLLGGGMGLGLALVQKLVEHLQGTIQVESSEGWTTFTVCFTS